MQTKHLRAMAAGLAIFAVGAAAGFWGGRRHSQFDLALAENKVAAANLRIDANHPGGTPLSPAFREYLKARIYCNVHNYYPSDRGYLLRQDWDFGPVDRQVLGLIGVWKDPHDRVWDWESAVTGK